jgi:NADPH2 dehydrogenase
MKRGIAVSTLFTPFEHKGLHLRNRVVMPPMCQYKADTKGFATKWHLMHYGARAAGGVGLIVQEATAVEARGRLSPNDLGIYLDEHIAGLREIVRFCHDLGAKMAIQLAHGGRKAWAGGEPIVAPTSQPFKPQSVTPIPLDQAGIEQVIEAFRVGGQRAVAIGYDAIELHGAHGYLINEFLSPYSNQRTDAYGLGFTGRISFLEAIVKAVRSEMPQNMPLFLRVSATEYIPDGLQPEDIVQVAQYLKPLGLDLIDVSTGGATPVAPERYPGYQLPHAIIVKEGAGLPTMAVGKLENPHLAEAVIRNKWADLVCVGKGQLVDPFWTAQAARQLGVDIEWGYKGQEP